MGVPIFSQKSNPPSPKASADKPVALRQAQGRREFRGSGGER